MRTGFYVKMHLPQAPFMGDEEIKDERRLKRKRRGLAR
jgi:hypothetical protein